MNNAILAVNAGSSSVKFSLFLLKSADGEPSLRCSGQVEGIGRNARLVVHDAKGDGLVDKALGASTTLEAAMTAALTWVGSYADDYSIVAAGHRVVHGGDLFNAPVLVSRAVLRDLERLVPLAPAHQPFNLAAIRLLSRMHPGLRQVACFDTAFHQTQPSLARAYALPWPLTASGVRRYGFHGLSYEYIASVLPDYAGDLADRRVVVAHLGHGASMCAMRCRRSIATTMGFTALDGLPMGRRCGSLDPGVVFYLMRECRLSIGQVEEILYEKSGLLGVSGISDDMRDLLASDKVCAAEAVDLFCYRIARELGSLAAALGGLDVLVFTGGIGEHAAPVRTKVGNYARWLGVRLDEDANRKGQGKLTGGKGTPVVLVIPTNEDLMIARHTLRVLREARETKAPEARIRNAAR